MVWSNQAPTFLVFPPGTVTGARMVIDQNGITIYNTDNTIALQIQSPPGLNAGIIDFFYDAIAANTPGEIIFNDNPGLFPIRYTLELNNSLLDQLTWYVSDGLGHFDAALAIDAKSNPAGKVTIPFLNVGTSFGHNTGGRLKVGAGVQGNGYYYEEATIANGTAMPLGVWANPTLTSSRIFSDYNGGATAFAGNVWTAPDDGIYHIYFRALTAANIGGVNSRYINRISTAVAGGGTIYGADEKCYSAGAGTSGGATTISIEQYFASGSTLNFGTFLSIAANTFSGSGVVVRRCI